LSSLLSNLEFYANEHHEGKFSLIKTHGKWHACFGVLEDADEILYIHSSDTFEGVIQNCLMIL
jgi:hypothetical protein